MQIAAGIQIQQKFSIDLGGADNMVKCALVQIAVRTHLHAEKSIEKLHADFVADLVAKGFFGCFDQVFKLDGI